MPSKDYQRYVSNEQQNRRKKRIIIEVLVSLFFIVTGILLFIFSKKFITRIILDKVQLKHGSDGYKTWLNPPITAVRSYYLFNITNPIEVATDPGKAIMYVKDTPPYVYDIKTNKVNVQWSNDNKEISYAVERFFTRHPTRFNPTAVNDTGTFVDVLRATFRTRFQTKPAQAFFDVSGMNTFYHRNAIEQLEGFTSELFYVMKDKMIGPNTDKSGFIYRQNGSQLYNVSIQTDQMKKGQVNTFASEINKFKIMNSSDYKFPVYDGLTYPSMLFDKPILNIFNSDFCRPIVIKFNRELSKFFGIKVHEYKIKLVDIDNCTNSNDTDTCNEVEKIDISKCVSDELPINTMFLSKAHFYQSNNETIQNMKIQGFTPNSDKHDSFIYFEPYTGTPFKAVLRIQVNIDIYVDPMKQSDYGSGLEPVKSKGVKRLLPIFWIDQEIDISPRIIAKLRMPLYLIHYGNYIIPVVAIGLSIVVILLIEFFARLAAKNDRYSSVQY